MTNLKIKLFIILMICSVAIIGYHSLNYEKGSIDLREDADRIGSTPDDLHVLYSQLRTNPHNTSLKTELLSRWYFYNRITKTGSRTLTDIIDKVSKPHLKQYQEFKNCKTEQERVLNVASKPPPFIVNGNHMHINYRDYGLDQPISFSIIRDPVDRFISQFYFDRNGDVKGASTPQQFSAEVLKRTIDECVDMAVSENQTHPRLTYYCGPDIRQQTRRFCGYDYKQCSNPDLALRKALVNLDDYIAVGLYEDYEAFIDVLERSLPQLFKGMLKEYKRVTDAYHEKFTTTSKKNPLYQTIMALKMAAKNEYIFYEAVKQRFQKLHSLLGPSETGSEHKL